MPERTCTIEGCGRKHYAKGWCNKHYMQRWQSSKICTVEGCGKPLFGRGWCKAHYSNWARNGEPFPTQDWHPAGAANPRWTGDSASYNTLHQRIKHRRGGASKHTCMHCVRRARHWAYDHTDPDERIGEDHGRTMTYSLDPARYIPLCVSCHKLFDRVVM